MPSRFFPPNIGMKLSARLRGSHRTILRQNRRLLARASLCRALARRRSIPDFEN